MLKKINAIIMSCVMLVISAGVVSADNAVYTFSGVNLVKNCNTTDIENVKLTDDILVTTAGDMNYKTVAITDIEHNKDCGYYPIDEEFTSDSSYIFMGCGNTNEHSQFILNLPKISANSKVTLTFAKPVITNNGSTRRNEYDPYAYFTIGSAKLSINTDTEFNKWYTKSVITDTETDCITFDCSKWGAVAISKIEVEPTDTPVYSLNIRSNQYANITANGIKYYADNEGNLSIGSLTDGETVKITAAKDGYTQKNDEVKIDGKDKDINISLEIDGDYTYYESDFGNSAGVLNFTEGDVFFAPFENNKYISASVTFKEGGALYLGSIRIEYRGDTTMFEGDAFVSDKGGNTVKDKGKGIFINDEFITLKNNMAFSIYPDAKTVTVYQNNSKKEIAYDGDIANAMTGENVSVDYIAISDNLPQTRADNKEFKDSQTANVDNISSYYIKGVSNGEHCYVTNTIVDNANIVSYRLISKSGKETDIEPTQIPATTVTKDGVVICTYYDDNKNIVNTRYFKVSANDKVEVSQDNKNVYFSDYKELIKLENPDTIASGFDVTSFGANDEFEIAPIYRFNDVGDVKEEKELCTVPNGLYDITLKKADTWRGDIFINGFMVGNNVDQADADRKVTDGAQYLAEDIKINTGKLCVSMTDGSTMLDYVEAVKKPDFYQRPQRLYVIGDSLACIYYGDYKQEVGGGRAGWGQQLENFLNIPVTDLANSGQYAKGLYTTAFPGVMHNAYEGDILLIECAYNDRNYSTREEMTNCVRDMIAQCREQGINPILVTPNASRHDYKRSVAWSGYLRDIAYDTNTPMIDLSKESYDFLYSLYGDDKDNVVTMNYNLTAVGGDTLHSSYAGAMKWAQVVASGLSRLGYNDIVNYDYKYEFKDTVGHRIKVQVNK